MEGAAVLNVLSTQCKALQIIKCYLHVMHLFCCLQDDLYFIECGFKGIVWSHVEKKECEKFTEKMYINTLPIHIRIY